MRARKTDANHRAILDAVRRFGYPCKSLHAQGDGVEDALVGLRRPPRWVVLEIKNLQGRGRRFTPAQVEWRERTRGYPRIVATGIEDAIKQLRAMEGEHGSTRDGSGSGNPAAAR